MGCAFQRYIGIDYSGAETPTSSLKGLRIYEAASEIEPHEVAPPPSPKRHWTREGIAQWLVATLADGPCALVGIDHAFSFPLKYFDKYGLERNWTFFLNDFQKHWPTDGNIYPSMVREDTGAARSGDNHWRRLTEVRARTAKSVFQFNVQGTVAHSTHAGLPWLLRLRNELGPQIHFWPFDGWNPPFGKSVVAEVYPALWSRTYPTAGRTPDQHDAFSVAEWMRRTDDGSLMKYFQPELTPEEKAIAEIEGWILGIG